MNGFGKPLRGNVMTQTVAAKVVTNALKEKAPDLAPLDAARISLGLAQFLASRGLAIVQVVDPRELKQ